MSARQAAVVAHTELSPKDCPLMDQPTFAKFRASLKQSNEFSLAVLEFLKKRQPREQAAWLATSVGASRAVFQPWSMELVYVLAVMNRARFTQLGDLLGISSRTLSDKLQSLREGGFVDREVFDEQPVRIEYFLTKHGRATAALASPLFAHLNHEALRAAGRV